jgi:hypothetical protein
VSRPVKTSVIRAYLAEWYDPDKRPKCERCDGAGGSLGFSLGFIPCPDCDGDGRMSDGDEVNYESDRLPLEDVPVGRLVRVYSPTGWLVHRVGIVTAQGGGRSSTVLDDDIDRRLSHGRWFAKILSDSPGRGRKPPVQP